MAQIQKKFIANDAVDKDKINADVAGNGLGQNVDGSLEVKVDSSTIEINSDTLRVKDAGITNAKVASGIDAAKLADGTVSNTELQYINSVTSDVQTQFGGKLSLTGGTMSGAIAMGTNKITGLSNGTNSADAVNLAQLQAVSAGLVWLYPINDPDLIDANKAAQPATPVSGDVYIASATAGSWTAGHAYFSPDAGTTWTDLLGRAVIAGDRFGISMESPTSAVGVLSGLDNYTVEILVATPGSVTVTSYAPVANTAVFVNQDASSHFGHQYTYDSATSAWIEFGGASAITPGVGLSFSGNILNINLGAGIKELGSDAVGIDFKSDGGVWLVDPTTGLASSANDAQLSAKLDGSTLSKSSSGIKVASGGITNTEVNASAAIAYSKLNLATSIVNADVSASAAIAYNKLNLASSIVNADVSASAAVAYSKLNLSASIVNADIASGASISVNKLAALTANKAVASDASGFLVASSVTDTELGYVSGVTSSIQTQLGTKLTSVLADTKIFVGSAGNSAVAQSMSGDATIANTGVITIANLAVTNAKIATGIDAAKLADGTVSNAEFQYINSLTSNAQTQIDGKMSNALATDKIFIGSAGGAAVAQTMSGDATIVASGAITIANLAVTNAKIATGVDAAKIADGTVSNAEFQYINSLTSNAQTQISARLQNVDSEVLTLNGTDITNQYKDLSAAAYSASSISLSVAGGPMQVRGTDYSVSLAGGVAGVTRITFLSDLATAGAAALVSGDILIVGYARL